MAPDADIVFRSKRTRAKGQIDVTPDKGTEPAINVYPGGKGTVKLGKADTEPRAVRVRSPSSQSDATNEVLGELRTADNAGQLRLWDQDSTGTRSRGISVEAGADPPGIAVARDGRTTVRLQRLESGGRVQLYDTTRSDPAFVAGTASNGAGELALTDGMGRTTCYAAGDEGALLLSGTPETIDDQKRSSYGGGELLIEEWQSSGDRDIHVHATGEGTSDYGVDTGNWPRIFIDGPESTLELGRHRLGPERRATNGRIRLRGEGGATLVELRATAGNRGEMSLFWSDGTERELRGRIQAHPGGLVVFDAGGRQALTIGPQGEVRTRRSVSRL
jgi:hypothetical protein